MLFSHEPTLVLLSICVAIIGCLLGLAAVWRNNRGTHLEVNALATGALFIGGTIWSMHFVAMTAVTIQTPLQFEIGVTALSFVLSCAATFAGLYVAGKRLAGKFSIPAGGFLMGLGIGAMHYCGMLGVVNCTPSFTLNGVLLSLVIGIVASTVALAVTFSKRGVFETIFGAIVLGGAICTFHYTAMASTVFFPERSPIGALIGTLNQDVIGYIVAGLVLSVSFLYFGRMVEE